MPFGNFEFPPSSARGKKVRREAFRIAFEKQRDASDFDLRF